MSGQLVLAHKILNPLFKVEGHSGVWPSQDMALAS